VFAHLQIPYRKERALVGLADAGLKISSWFGWPHTSRRRSNEAPRRILLLRLEKVGDLVMVLEAIALVRAMAPDAVIDLVVGSWNRALAGLIPGVTSVETLDVPWIAPRGAGLTWAALVGRAKAWRARRYDLAINFEPDIRSNLLLALSGASRRVGFLSGGGGAVLTDAVAPDPRAHIAENAKSLVLRAFDHVAFDHVAFDHVAQDFSPAAAAAPATLNIPDAARRTATELLGTFSDGVPLIGIQPATGKRIKEWDPIRFAEVGAALARTRGARIVVIGSTSDRPVVDAMRAAWPADVPLYELPADVDLIVLAAALERLSLFITGDTGPMHMAAAVGIPVLAIFGPSLPTRYAPLSPKSRIIRIDIHCSPCNLMRQPPTRCLNRVPDCLAGIASSDVLRAANEMLDAS
jgi:ADP-heptose:LPS heptosyltransferase